MGRTSSPDCAVCEEGYAPGFHYSCRSCLGEERKAAIAVAMAVLAIALVGVSLMVANLVRMVDGSTVGMGCWENRCCLSWRTKVADAVPLTSIKILVVAWQIITQVTNSSFFYCFYYLIAATRTDAITKK